MGLRIGHGYDVHKFADPHGGNPAAVLTLGGVKIPHDRALLAHSDGDVVVHALCDAILGALGAGDIGQRFPDDDPHYADIDSLLLLTDVMKMAGLRNWQLVNADLTIVAQQPRLASFLPAMGERLAATCGVSAARINLKATTTEGLGFTGRQEGIAAYAVVLLEQVSVS